MSRAAPPHSNTRVFTCSALGTDALHRTTLIDHRHGTVDFHQEGPDRVASVVAALTRAFSSLPVVDVPEEAKNAERRLDADLVAAHTRDYLDRLKRACDETDDGEEGTAVGELTPKLLPEKTSGGTRFSKRSFEAALTAVDVVVKAVEFACETPGGGRAFCVVRPPGHHACPNGPNERVGGCGFCLVNTVAVAVAWARRTRRSCRRVAVVDFDVHHGNGTVECLEMVHAGSDRRGGNDDGAKDDVLYASTHLLETFEDPDLDFFPGTGHRQEKGTLITTVNCPLTPLWVKKTKRGERKGRLGFRAAVVEDIIPALERQRPDLILINMGFDGADGDIGNTSMEGHVGLDLTDDDFEWATRRVCQVNGGHTPVVSVLEGGYGKFADVPGDDVGFERGTLVSGAVAHVRGLISSSLSTSSSSSSPLQ